MGDLRQSVCAICGHDHPPLEYCSDYGYSPLEKSPSEPIAFDTGKTVRRQIETTVTLTEEEYSKILRTAVRAPADAKVEVEDTFGGDIKIKWTVVEQN